MTYLLWALEALKPELASALNAAAGELRGLVDQELRRRKEIVTDRVLEAIEAVTGGARREMAVGQLLEFSAPVQRIAVLGWAGHIYTANESGLGPTAKALLETFERATVEMGRKI